MNCRQIEEKLADWSADNLPEPSCDELQAHLQQCPPCARHWNEFQTVLTFVSTASQPVLPPEKTQEMWSCCERYLNEKIERERKGNFKVIEPTRAWWQISPRWGWASLAGAFAVLAVAGLTPQNSTRPLVTEAPSNVQTQITNRSIEPREEWVRFTLPPDQASPFINHHTTMAFDPFADHVASTLISDTATNVSLINDAAQSAPPAFADTAEFQSLTDSNR